jgi:hypothetical protein
VLPLAIALASRLRNTRLFQIKGNARWQSERADRGSCRREQGKAKWPNTSQIVQGAALATTFDVLSTAHVGTQHSWQRFYEAFCLCRHCSRTTTFVIALKNPRDEDNTPETIRGNINDYFELDGYISLKDVGATEPPDHVPPDLAKIFKEATKCVAVQCRNAAGAMFRLCVDRATEQLLPEGRCRRLDGFHSKKSRAAP